MSLRRSPPRRAQTGAADRGGLGDAAARARFTTQFCDVEFDPDHR